MMHWIPQSWSHLHILVSVFPSVGLIFVLGFYITAFLNNNEVMKRTCLVLLVVLGLLAIPTYLSGDGSWAVFSEKSEIPKNVMNIHYWWGLAALAILVLTAAAALFELWQSRTAGKLSDQTLNLILGLAIGTLVLMIVADDYGFEINHHELRSTAALLPGVSTPQAWSFVHMVLNHFPTVGFVTALAVFVTALVMNNDVMKRSSLALFVICGALIVPTYVTGTGSMWALTRPEMPGISKAVINAHRDIALLALFGLAFTGGTAWIELWRARHLGRFSNAMLYTVLVFAIITLGVLAETGHRGGQINHPEIRVATDILPTDPNAGWTPAIELAINNVIWFVPWQTVHFFGYSMIFGVALVIVLRVLGFWKSVPFSAVHRILPIGFFGVMMNVFTGMLMMLADSYRYVVTGTTFAPKMALIPIAVMAVLYFSFSDRIWSVKAGEEAPGGAKAVAVLVILAWTGVIIGGRLLPYL
jgi:uncharacterized membrane protein